MTSVDDLFKKPGLPSNKRKLEPLTNPDQVYKSAKLTTDGDVKGKARVEDVEDDEDIEAGPELPPDDEEEEKLDDEEGRFFGGGVSKYTADVLDFIGERDDQGIAPEKLDVAWVRRLAVNFERKISKNAELRAKFEDDPQKFLGSEADLDAEIKGLSILTDHPELYEEFARLGCVRSLVSLLAHENADIAIDAVEVIAELIDEDVEVNDAQWDFVANAMLDSDLPDLLVQNFGRLDEANETDRVGTYHSLSVMESLASKYTMAEKVVESSQILPWLLQRIRKKELVVTQNKQYSAEVLAILLQSSSKIRMTAIALEAVDTTLQLLATFRKRDPDTGSEEEIYAENLFDALACLVEDSNGKQKFVEAEGLELLMLMLKEGRFSKPRALRVLDHAVGGTSGAVVCEKLVESGGLKTIFHIFMKRMDQMTTEHVLGIFASMLRSLPGGSATRIRTLAKFVEKDHEKIAKLVILRRGYLRRLAPIEEAIKIEAQEMTDEEKEEMASEWLTRRLDNGLFVFQIHDVILAWLIAEDGGARKKIVALLGDNDETLMDIKATLEEQLAGLEGRKETLSEEDENAVDMLKTLVDCLA